MVLQAVVAYISLMGSPSKGVYWASGIEADNLDVADLQMLESPNAPF